MNKKIFFGVVALTIVAGLIAMLTFAFSNNKEYDDFVDGDKKIPYSEITDESVEIRGGDVTSEEERVLKFFANLGVSGGIQKIDVSSYSDVEPPEIVQQYDVEYYYLVTTATYTYTAIFVDGELLTNYEEINLQ